MTYFQDLLSFVLFHIFSFKLYPCHFFVSGIIYFSLYDFGRISMALQFLRFFSSCFYFAPKYQVKSKCIFLSLKSVMLEGSWQVEDKTRLNSHRRCDERQGCEINASLDIRLEEDPCPGTEKYLEAHYVCHSLSEGPPTQGLV